MAEMTYRRLGGTGLKVSTLSFGSWVTFAKQLDDTSALDSMAAAYDAGVNFFDNAEAYERGASESLMGRVTGKLGWPRHSYVVSTKLFWGIHGGFPSHGVNMRNTLNRKYLMQAIDGSLERMGLDFVDLLYCHRADPDTPVEETVWAMSDIIDAGKALYWGTSEWPADAIREAWDIADRRNLHKPVVEQPEYHLLHREKVEEEFADLYDSIGLGLTTWSPLASGLLTGKYVDGVPGDSRASVEGYGWLAGMLTDEEANARVRNLVPIADELGCTLAQLAIAWCARNPHVSTVITGASRVEQVHENLKAIDVLEQLDEDVMARIDAAVA